MSCEIYQAISIIHIGKLKVIFSGIIPKEFFRKSLVNSEYELEWIYGSHPRNSLKKSEFLKVLNDLRQNFKFKSETNDLDIRSQNVKLEKSGLSNIRCTIPGIQNIKKYCKNIGILPTLKH